jgi:protein-S-isoprenylcysteine O-methyltransferase Ste14
MSTDRYRQATWIAAFTERYVLSVIYLGFAYGQWVWVRLDWPGWHAHDPVYLGYFSEDFTLFALDLIMGLVLLLGRRAAVAPRNLAEIAVPLAASFYFVLFSYVPLLPDSLGWLRAGHAPASWQTALDYTGLAMGVLGIAFSTWGLLALGRSFGIFVAVRTVVLGGPYRLVRHPMYGGYILASVGLLLANANLALVLLVPLQAALFAWRARLEEARLAEFSADYREYQRRTGFFWPKFGG